MAFIKKDIKDRIVTGGNKYNPTNLPDFRIQLIPAPDSVTEAGTPINKALLQRYEDTLDEIMNVNPYAKYSELNTHIINKLNPHGVTKAQVGLGNVTNDKQATKTEFDNHTSNKLNPHEVTKSQVGLGNVTNDKQFTREEFDKLNLVGGTNLGIPNLEDKDYLGNGVYRIGIRGSFTHNYNVYNGIHTFNGVLNVRYDYLSNLIYGTYVSTFNKVSGSFTGYSIIQGLYNGGTPRSRTDISPSRNAFPVVNSGNNTNSHLIILSLEQSTTFDNFQFTLQIEKGSTATDYTVPIQPIIYHETKYLEDEKVDNITFNNELTQVYGGKNLAVPNLTGKEYLGNGNYLLNEHNGITYMFNVYFGIFTLNGTSTAYSDLDEQNIFESQNDLIISYLYVGGNINKNFIINTRGTIFTGWLSGLREENKSSYWSTTRQNISGFYIGIEAGTVIDNLQFKIQIEKGSVATPYTLPMFVTPELLDTKVDKVSGKGLSTNDFTNTLKTKLDGIESGAEKNVGVEYTQTEKTKLAGIATGAQVNPYSKTELDNKFDNKADKSELPTKTSDLTNDSDFATTTYVDSAYRTYNYIVMSGTNSDRKLYFTLTTKLVFPQGNFINASSVASTLRLAGYTSENRALAASGTIASATEATLDIIGVYSTTANSLMLVYFNEGRKKTETIAYSDINNSRIDGWRTD